MTDTVKTFAQLKTLFADNSVGAISAQDLRDFVETLKTLHGAIHLSSESATAIAVSGTYVKAAGTTVRDNDSASEITMPANNRLQYSDTIARKFIVICNSTWDVASGTDIVVGIKLAINGVVVDTSEVKTTVTKATGITYIATTHFLTLNSGDYVELWVANHTNTTNLTLKVLDLNLLSYFGA